jgi:hypothetical protein
MLKRPEKADGPFRSISRIGLAGDDSAPFAGVSEADADRDSIRGHHDRFVYRRLTLQSHSTCN